MLARATTGSAEFYLARDYLALADRVETAEARAVAAEARVAALEEALKGIADNPDAASTNIDGEEIKPFRNKRGEWRGSARLLARAALQGAEPKEET